MVDINIINNRTCMQKTAPNKWLVDLSFPFHTNRGITNTSRNEEQNFERKHTNIELLPLVPKSQDINCWFMNFNTTSKVKHKRKIKLRMTCQSVLHLCCPRRLKYVEFIIVFFNVAGKINSYYMKERTTLL